VDRRAQEGCGDFARRHVLETPMLEAARGARHALDVRCGEGRCCRMVAAQGVRTVGVDPTAALLARARALHPEGRAEALPVEDGAFDLVVSCLTLIDIPDLRSAIPETALALAPGGRLLIANLQSFQTACPEMERLPDGGVVVNRHLEDRAPVVERSGIRVACHHRPLSTYMRHLLGVGLRLERFEEPRATGGDPGQVARHLAAPWLLLEASRRP
jgi:SAM-dependent methyltransferase